MKKYVPAVAAALVVGTIAVGGTIKTWSTGEVMTSAQINSNFTHIHNNMVGGHGPRLTNNDVSTSAAISHSKLANPPLVPKAWGYQANVLGCPSGPCTSSSTTEEGLTFTGVDAGITAVTWDQERPDMQYSVVVSLEGATSEYHRMPTCHVETKTTAYVLVRCIVRDPEAITWIPYNTQYSLIMMDDDN